MTLGAAGCALFRRGRPALALAGHTVQVADTIGAGDTFTGAMAASLARGEPIEAALAWANAAAALSVGARGAIAGMPGLDAVRALLALALSHCLTRGCYRPRDCGSRLASHWERSGCNARTSATATKGRWRQRVKLHCSHIAIVRAAAPS